ncbi:Lactate utilization protein A [Fundidesulfovibrio magnetotacticus]|uniref:Lactate utilization protein A n=1 Tax=Fundidesulfovibrio magnetotacticus TaxID=2730080 RepID=A0A6V8LRX6_9BACT|nr:(Fe-S)-binding protein [Fundidesulfovibrio magnetotacticus]GFK92869.1 Lactate utilization protein A [Fundidesulfovibrio magnetotacticus]
MNRPSPAGKVLLFGTCLADAVFPDAGMASIRLLENCGFQVAYPLEQGCCGQPAYNSGFPDEARAVALAQVKAFAGSDAPVVVPSGSCAGMLRHHYPALFEGRPELFEVLAFSARVREFCEFLAEAAPTLPDSGPPVRAVWHSSCHALRETGSTPAAKALLRALPGVELVELAREWECCGFGGTFSVKRPEISAAMVRDKVEDVLAARADVLLTADCGCLLNITSAAQRMGRPVRGMHVAEFLWERVSGTASTQQPATRAGEANHGR